jgi:hypothetical protein
MALPLLESAMPATRLFGASAAAKAFPTRMAFLYIPNGVNVNCWFPKEAGANYELPYTLAPLADFKNDITVFSQLDNNQANDFGDGGGGHARASATFLTGVHPRKTAGSDIKAGVSVDQVAAEKVGDQTKLPSLELSCDHGQRAGSCDSGYSCAYQFNISWKSESMPMNPEVDPKLAFDRLFGSADDAATKEARAKRDFYNKSVLDFVLDDAASLNKTLSGNDQRKLDEYLSAVRDLERRIESSQKYVIELSPEQRQMKVLADYNFQAHARLQMDIMALAFQTDATRISTFILGHDGSNRPYPQATAQGGYESGISEGHHDLSHHRNDPDKLAKLAVINRYHASQFAYLLGKLKAVKEGDGTLLDNCMIMYGGGLSDGNSHTPENVPVVLAGRGGNRIAAGQHIHLGELTPLTNLYRSMLDVMGAPTEKIGDSNGKLDAIFKTA